VPGLTLQLLAALHIATGALAGTHGIVRAADYGGPAAGVRVELDGIARGVTDSTGHYALSAIIPGQHEFRFSAAGFESQRIVVVLTDGADLNLDVELTRRAIELPPIDAIGQRPLAVGDATELASAGVHEPGRFRFSTGWQADLPAGGVDVMQVMASVPGVASRSDNTTALSVRGGRGSENMMLLDGIPLQGASHFAGASSGVNPDAIAAIDVHTGVNSARYDGALSGVMELHTPETTQSGMHGAASTTISDMRAIVQMPLGAGGILLGGRSSFRDMLTDGSGLGVVNGYQDFLGVVRLPLGRGTLRLVSFESGNRMGWENYGGAPDATLEEGRPATVADRANTANWQSSAVGATWTRALSTQSNWHAAAWWSGSRTLTASHGITQSQQLSSGIGQFGLSTELRQQLRGGSLLVGAEVTQPSTWYDVTTSSTSGADSVAPIALRDRSLHAAVFGEWSWHASERLGLRVGLRGNSDFLHRVALAPRFVLDLQADPSTRIEAGFGRTHQAVQSMLNEENIASTIISPALPVATAAGTPIAWADHVTVGITHRLGEATTLSLDSYFRSWHDVLTPATTTGGYFAATAPERGDGRSSGVIASIATAWGPVSLRAHAGLARATQLASSGAYHIGAEQPWSFSGDLAYHPGIHSTVQMQWATGAGQPSTLTLPGLEWQPYAPSTGTGEMEGAATNLSGAINPLRLPGRLRLDLSYRHLWTVGTGTHQNGLTTALRLENVLNRLDPAGIGSRPDGSLQWLRGTPRGVVFELGWVF